MNTRALRSLFSGGGHRVAQVVRALRTKSYPRPEGFLGRARVAVITVIQEEFEAAQNALGLTRNIAETPYYVSDLTKGRDWEVVLTQATDRSNIPIAGDVTSIISDLRPQILMLVGVAGGLCNDGIGRDGINLGHVLIAEFVGYVEFLKITDKGTFLRHYAIDHPSLSLRRNVAGPLLNDFRLADAVTMSPPHPIEPRIHIGPIVSGEKVMGGIHDPVQMKLLEPFDNSLAVDMESFGIARQVCEKRTSFWYHPRYMIIRGISDLVGPAENPEIRRKWKPFAAHAAAIVAKEFIRRLPGDPAPE